MKKLFIFFIGTLFIFSFVQCNKNERAFKRFIKEGRWKINLLQAGTTEYTKLPKWQIYDCADHTENCLAKWEHQNGSSCQFYWKFYNLGGDFEFYADPLEADQTSMAFAQCSNFQGHYKVMNKNYRSFHFQSDEIAGYPGKDVIIKMEKQ